MRLNSKLKDALVLLHKALDYAQDSQSDRWDFAVSIEDLRSLGLDDNDLRWLIKRNAVEHAREVTREFDEGREFHSMGKLTFSRQTCFVLTDNGVQIASSIQQELFPRTKAVGHVQINGSSQAHDEKASTAKPHWDPELRKLYLGNHLVKRFKWPAMNQEAVLCAFQEEGWPERIDDPLPPQPEQDPKRRLADTIKCLNRKQATRLLHFRGDGTGEGVIWELIRTDFKRTPQVPDTVE